MDELPFTLPVECIDAVSVKSGYFHPKARLSCCLIALAGLMLVTNIAPS